MIIEVPDGKKFRTVEVAAHEIYHDGGAYKLRRSRHWYSYKWRRSELKNCFFCGKLSGAQLLRYAVIPEPNWLLEKQAGYCCIGCCSRIAKLNRRYDEYRATKRLLRAAKEEIAHGVKTQNNG